MVDTSGLTTEIQARIQDIPSALSAGSIRTTLEFVVNDVSNYTGESISKTDVPTKYQNILINYGCAYVLANKVGVGVDFNFELGEFSVDRGNLANNPDTVSMKFFVERANESMRWVGRRTPRAKVYGV